MGEAKAPVRTFYGMSVSYEESTQAREDPKISKSKEGKVLMEVIISMLYRIMHLLGKYIGGGIGCPTRPSQSKGTSSRLEGRELEEE
jgi:hypothetical protein